MQDHSAIYYHYMPTPFIGVCIDSDGSQQLFRPTDQQQQKEASEITRLHTLIKSRTAGDDEKDMQVINALEAFAVEASYPPSMYL